MLTLLVIQGPDKGRRFELPDAPVPVGRDSRQLAITDYTVSRRHCELIPVDDAGMGTGGTDASDGGSGGGAGGGGGGGPSSGWLVRDAGSSNGTYVNGLRVTGQALLKQGDQIRVGNSIFVFGAQPGVSRTSGRNVALAGQEAGMDSSIMHAIPGSDDSMVLAVPEPAAAAMSNLKILYQLAPALGSSFNVDQVLEVVMDLVLEHVQADRGLILLVDPRTDEPVAKVVRVRDETGGRAKLVKVEPTEKITASRTIVNHVISSGEGVLSSNAMADQRFSKGKSVHNLGIRSALCVPIKSRRLTAPEGEAGGGNAKSQTRNAKGEEAGGAGGAGGMGGAAGGGNAKSKMRNAKGEDGAGGAGGAGEVPVRPMAHEEIVGVIYIDSSVKNYTYSPDQLRLLSAIGLQAGMAVQNATLYAQQLRAERLAAVGETTAALSHSIKNILQALRGGADVVEMGLRAANVTQAQKGWRVVDRNLDKIYNLTLNLLAYSRPREPRLEMVNPRVLVNDCLELIAQAANEKGVMAVADVDADHPAIPMDPDGMHQVLMNLLSNALDAVEPRKGLVQVVCRYDDRGKAAVIDVIDNGEGIAPEMTNHMFELFHSTKGNRGTGLGLAVARKIVEEHEGQITARSKPGEGTTFTLRLPVYHANLADPSHTHGPAARG